MGAMSISAVMFVGAAGRLGLAARTRSSSEERSDTEARVAPPGGPRRLREVVMPPTVGNWVWTVNNT
jgi:hypothetical protein